MEVRLLGTGGWLPTDERETACMYVRSGPDVLLLDAGTGARRLITEPALLAGVERLHVVLSHFHLDHVMGLVALAGLDLERQIWMPARLLAGLAADEVFERLVGPPFFTGTDVVGTPRELEGDCELGSFRIEIRLQPQHPGKTIAVKVDGRLAYCTDTAYDPENIEFARGVSILLHESRSGLATRQTIPVIRRRGRRAGSRLRPASSGSCSSTSTLREAVTTSLPPRPELTSRRPRSVVTGSSLCEGEDVVQLDVDPGRRATSERADPVALLEAKDERVHRVVGAVELVEAEGERRGLLAGHEEQSAFDVVRSAEVVTLLERELPVDSRLGPLFDHIGEQGERFVHVDRHWCVGPFLGRPPGVHFERRHDASLPRAGTPQT